MSERFASDQPKQPQPFGDPAKLQSIATAAVLNTRAVKINKKLVQKSTQDQIMATVANLLAAGRKDDKVVTDLVKAGQSQEYAAGLVGSLRQAIEAYKSSPEGIRAMVKKHRSQMIWGAVGIVVGLAVTIGTFKAAIEGGGYYFIFYGPVIWGVYYLITGAIGYFKYKSMESSGGSGFQGQ
jgi:hypothetical protein